MRCIYWLLIWMVVCCHSIADTIDDGLNLFKNQEFIEAQKVFMNVITEDNSLPAHYWLGRCAYSLNNFDVAADQFIYVLDRKPTSTDSFYWLGKSCQGMGYLNDAKSIFTDIIEAEPTYIEALNSLREVLLVFMERGISVDSYMDNVILVQPSNRMSLEIDNLDIRPGDVQVYSQHVYDYTFADPPTDWRAHGGEWEITNRWTCSPQWSWYGGYSENGIASIWNKKYFEGNITIEAYMAFKMGVNKGEAASYRNPNDMNITICGDGINPGTGYSFIYGGQLNSVSCIMKNTEVLVENRESTALLPIFEDKLPPTYEFHRKWWAVRIHKIGGHLQFYVDDKLICETQDDDPLRGGHVSIWTVNNGLIISRIKVYFEKEIF